MNLKWKIFLVAAAFITVGSLTGMFFSAKSLWGGDFGSTAENSGGSVAGASTLSNDDYLTRLASSLSSNGAILYGSYTSQDTIAQKALFKNASGKLNYVECDAAGPEANPDECLSRAVSVYPTWIYQGNKLEGTRSLSDLAKMIDFSQ